MPPKSLKQNARQSLKLTSRRIRPGLPGIRGLYRNYETAGINWQHIFTTMHTKTNKTKELRQLFPGVKYTTFMTRYKKWCKADSPDDGSVATTDNRGGHNAAMTVAEESLCASFVKEMFIDGVEEINQSDLKEIIISYYQQLHPHVTRDVGLFACSGSFLQRFEKKWGIFHTSGRTQKQPQLTDTTLAHAQLYIAK